MAQKEYVNRCIFCGKYQTTRRATSTPAIMPPSIFGKCPSSPDGKHKPRWEEK